MPIYYILGYIKNPVTSYYSGSQGPLLLIYPYHRCFTVCAGIDVLRYTCNISEVHIAHWVFYISIPYVQGERRACYYPIVRVIIGSHIWDYMLLVLLLPIFRDVRACDVFVITLYCYLRRVCYFWLIVPTLYSCNCVQGVLCFGLLVPTHSHCYLCRVIITFSLW